MSGGTLSQLTGGRFIMGIGAGGGVGGEEAAHLALVVHGHSPAPRMTRQRRPEDTEVFCLLSRWIESKGVRVAVNAHPAGNEAIVVDALAHGVLPGIALAFLLGFPGILGAAIGAAFMIGGITAITARSRLSSDTAIGLLFIGMLSLGVVIVSRSRCNQEIAG